MVKEVGARYVIGAIYGDTEGSFYSFSKKEEYIQFNPEVLIFMQAHQQTLYRLTNYEFIKFLQRNNSPESCTNLIDKVENVTQRSTLSGYRQILQRSGSEHCFYCDKQLISNVAVEVDHFIPWSFIHNDQLWNLVLACRTCNNSKRDKVADTTYLEKLIVRNKLFLLTVDSLNEDLKTYNENKLKDLHKYVLINGYEYGWRPQKDKL